MTLYKGSYRLCEYLAQGIQKQQSIKGRTISAVPPYTSIKSANWLLAWDIVTVGTLQKGGEGILSDLFDTKDIHKFIATCHFDRKRKLKKDICLTSYAVKTRSKGRKRSFVVNISSFTWENDR